MITTVLVFNVLIASLCFYAAWRLWQLQKALAKTADALIAAEKSTHSVLHDAPKYVTKGQKGTLAARLQYQKAAVQLEKAQKLVALLGLGQIIWRQYRSIVPVRRTRRLTSFARLVRSNLRRA